MSRSSPSLLAGAAAALRRAGSAVGGAVDAAGRPVQRLHDRWARWAEAEPAAARHTERALHAAALAALALGAVAWGQHIWTVYGGSTVDDAGITYAYAEHVAAGEGFRMTPGEAPTEGFSNPLQVLLLVPVAFLSDDLDPASKALNIGLAAAALGLLCAFVYVRLRLAARLFAFVPLALAVYWSGFACWIASGLEGGLLAGLQILSLLGVWHGPERRTGDVGLGVAAGLLAWVRPEGFVYGAIAIAARWIRAPAVRRRLAPAIFVGFIVALVGFRFAVFRELVPNTYWAKVPGAGFWWSLGDLDGKGWRYVTTFFEQRWWYFALPLWAFALAWRKGAAVTAAAFAQLLFAILFPLWTGGDWMLEWRFLQPMMGPLAVLCALGLIGLLGTERRPARNVARCLAALGGFALAVAAGFVPSDWSAKEATIAARRDIDLRTVRERAVGYRRLSAMLHLGRRMLVAEVDVGGVSYRSGLDVLDLGGLADRALGLARGRRPAVAPDYLFGERRPDVIHLQASWLFATPYHALGPFRGAYRPIARGLLERLEVPPLTAVRDDLLDPPAAPALRLEHSLPTADIAGVSALAAGGDRVLVVHARQRGGFDAPPPTWVDARGERRQAVWHAGITLAVPGPPGTPLAAVAVVPASAALPLVLEGTPIRIERWPDSPADDGSVEALARLPYLRIAGRPVPGCDPERVLDSFADPASRARGAGFVARVCGGLPGARAERWRERAMEAAEAASDPDQRYDAAAATLWMGVPQWLSTRRLLEETRPAHAPYDEVLDAWARADFAAALDRPERVVDGLRMLLAARRFGDVVLQGLAWGIERPGVAPVVCAAARKLGLRPDAVSPFMDCSTVVRLESPVLFRQGFENASDPLLRFEGSGGDAWEPTTGRRDGTKQRPVVGGQRSLLLNTFDGETGDAAVGSVVWGPFPWAGRRFGVLVGGGRDLEGLYVAVEALVGGEWTTLARVGPADDAEVLRPRIVDLGERRGTAVRVRVVDASAADWGHLLVDGITFVDWRREAAGGW